MPLPYKIKIERVVLIMENIKELRKKIIKKLEDYKEYIDQSTTEENYTNLINIAIDYDNEAQDNLYLYDTIQELVNFIDEEILQQLIEINAKYGIARLRYFINNTYDADIYKIDGYENLENVTDSDFKYCADELIKKISEEIENG